MPSIILFSSLELLSKSTTMFGVCGSSEARGDVAPFCFVLRCIMNVCAGCRVLESNMALCLWRLIFLTMGMVKIEK